MTGERKIALGDGDSVVVEPWDETSTPRLKNLVRIDASGAVQWRACLPEGTGPDCFIAVDAEAGALFATTWSGHRVRLDPVNGRHLQMTFVK